MFTLFNELNFGNNKDEGRGWGGVGDRGDGVVKGSFGGPFVTVKGRPSPLPSLRENQTSTRNIYVDTLIEIFEEPGTNKSMGKFLTVYVLV